MKVAEPLYIVKDQPSQADEHEKNEGDGDKQHRRTIQEGILGIDNPITSNGVGSSGWDSRASYRLVTMTVNRC